eukprot:5207474-Heterocapsa_arctica.AAC.1
METLTTGRVCIAERDTKFSWDRVCARKAPCSLELRVRLGRHDLSARRPVRSCVRRPSLCDDERCEDAR